MSYQEEQLERMNYDNRSSTLKDSIPSVMLDICFAG